MRFCGQHLGGEAGDAELLGDRGQVLEQHRADALALEVVADVEGDLGAAGVDPVVAADADDVVAHRRDEGDPVGVVDVGEPVDVGVAQLAQRREEAQVDRLVGLRGVEAPDAVGVGRADRPHVGDGAVAQDDVGLPLRGVAGRERLVLHGPIVPPRGSGPGPAHWAPWSSATPSCTAAWCAASTRTVPVPPRGRRATSSGWPCARRAPGSARAGTSWPCSTRPTARRSGRRPTTARPPDAWRRGVGAAPALVLCLSDPGAYLDRYAAARQGLDRPLDRPLAGPLLGHRRRHGGDGPAARRARTPAWGRCSSGCRSSGTTRSARRTASRPAAGSSASWRSVTRRSGCRARRAPVGRRPLDEVLHVGRFGNVGVS